MPFITPDFQPSFNWYQIAIPLPLVPYVIGALEELCDQRNWEIWGNMTPDEITQMAEDVVIQFIPLIV